MNDEELEDLMYRAGLTAQGCWDSMDQYAREAIMDFAKRVAAAEREACAKLLARSEVVPAPLITAVVAPFTVP